MRCAIHSANAGSVMVIPQERDLVRLYIQLPIQVVPGERVDKSKVTPEFILETARRVLHPYTLDTDHIDWFTGYHMYVSHAQHPVLVYRADPIRYAVVNA